MGALDPSVFPESSVFRSVNYDAIVIGSGLAGGSAAHQLARRGHTVCLLERSTLPRHKLCGEFLSPEAQASFQRLDLLDAVAAEGPSSMTKTRLTAPSGASTEHPLPGTAWGLSRYRLDSLLFRRACANGVDGRMGTHATAVQGTLADGFRVDTTEGLLRGRLVLGAYGRRARLDRTLDRPFFRRHSPYVAFKAHYDGPGVPDAIELHSAPGGYCGVSPIEGNRATVCWIGRAEALKEAGGTPEAMLASLRQNPALDDRLASLTQVSDRFEAVSQVPLMPKSRFANGVCMIGDSAGMIAPLCGDGMAMALRTADLVVPRADAFLNDSLSPEAFQTRYEDAWTRQFGRRMCIGRWVHRTAFRPGAAAMLVEGCRWIPPLARWLIRNTRGSAATVA